MNRRARLLFLLAWILGLLLLVPSGAAVGERVYLVEVDGPITPVIADYIDRSLKQAADLGAEAVVVRLNTPGGLSSAMDDIVQDILQSPVPVVVYVAPEGARAASAGVFITYAAHVAAMAPATNIGSASPVLIGQDGQTTTPDETMQRKVVNDAVAKIRSLAERRGRNADWAEQAVREAVNITAEQAAALHVVDLVAPSLDALLEAIDGRTVTTTAGEVTLRTKNAEVVPITMTVLERFFQILSDPNIAYILLSLGMLGLFFELANPGAILPGVLGGILILLGLYALGMLDVNWAGVFLMAFAFLLFLIDLYVPTHGVLTLGGIISFALGSLLLLQSPANPAFQLSRSVIIAVTGTVATMFLLLVYLVARAHARRPATGREALIGARAVVRRALEPEGLVFVEGELWRARSLSGPIPAGQRVRIVGIEGLVLLVEPFTAEVAESAPSTAPMTRRWRPLEVLFR
ncbi:MAG: NfeD family protein, partial [Thermomicrobium sp.]